jgi:hypothetical protein
MPNARSLATLALTRGSLFKTSQSLSPHCR